MSKTSLVAVKRNELSNLMRQLPVDVQESIRDSVAHNLKDTRLRGTWDEVLRLQDIELLKRITIHIYQRLLEADDIDPKLVNAFSRLIGAKDDIIDGLMPHEEKHLHLHVGEESLRRMVVGDRVVDGEFKNITIETKGKECCDEREI